MALKKRNRGQVGPGKIESLTKRDLIVWIDTSDTQHVQPAGPAMLTKPLHLARRVRTGFQYKAQRNYHGLYWFAQTDQHVWHESLFEMSALMSLDFFHEIEAISAQPMMMQFADGTVHYPDFFATHADGTQVVYDVRPRSRVTPETQAQFDQTKRVCDLVGWKYELFTHIHPAVKANLEWIAGYRHPRYTPSDALRNRVLDAATTPVPFEDLIRVANDTIPALGAMVLYNLIWNRSLQFDMTSPLTSYTTILKGTSHDND
jgi:hypothetical protein